MAFAEGDELISGVPTRTVYADANRDRRQPRPQGPPRIDPVPGSVGAEQRLLYDILGGVVGHPTPGKPFEPWAIRGERLDARGV
jgi:hypothetical protein